MNVRPGTFRAWILAIRPLTLPLGAAPVLLGAALALAAGSVDVLAIAAALLSALLLQIGSNLANDLFDNDKGADSGTRLGPTRVTQAGLLTRGQVKAGMAVSFGLATAFGAYLVAVGGWPIVLIGLASILAAIAYTGGPYPLGYHGLGELFVLLFFGFVAVAGTAYVAAGHFLPIALPYGATIGMLAAAVLVVNNVRDREGDLRAGKRTLVVRLGRRFGVLEYALALVAAVAIPGVLVVLGKASPWTALSWLAVAMGFGQLRLLQRTEGAPLNRVLARTGQVTFLYALLLSVGILLGR